MTFIEYYLNHYKGIIIYHYKLFKFIILKNYHYDITKRNTYRFILEYLKKNPRQFGWTNHR